MFFILGVNSIYHTHIIRGIYTVASRKIRRDIIIEVLKDETV